MHAPFDATHLPAPLRVGRVESQSAGNSCQDSASPRRQIPGPPFAKLPEFLLRLQALNQWQITEGLTPFGFAWAAPPEHAGVRVLGLKLRDQKRDEVALCGAVLLEGLPQPVTEQWLSGIAHIGEHVLLDRCAPVSQAVPKFVLNGGGFDTHEAIVASPRTCRRDMNQFDAAGHPQNTLDGYSTIIVDVYEMSELLLGPPLFGLHCGATRNLIAGRTSHQCLS